MFRIAKLEGIALVLFVSSTSHAGLPTQVNSGIGAPAPEVVQAVPRARHLPVETRVVAATPAAIDLALWEIVERFEQAVEDVATAEPAERLASWLSDSPAPRDESTEGDAPATEGPATEGPATEGPPRPETHEAGVFTATQHGPFDDLLLAAAQRWRLSPFLLKGLIANESNLEPVRAGKRRYGEHNGKRMVVSGGAIGIAQFSGGGIRAVQSLRDKRRRRGEATLGFDLERALVPQEAIFAAAELLAYLLDRYGHDGGITAYNTGVTGGLAVSRLGFWRARRAGKLRRSGVYHVQGDHFLLNVLRRTNRFRRAAGLTPMPRPKRPKNLSPAVTRVAVL